MADNPCIVGRDDEKKKIIQMLTGSELEYWTGEATSSTMSNVRVISLVGMGGVGKTTLARLVFSDPTVKQHFHVLIWVCVSENFDVNRITKEILEVISPDQQKELFEISKNWDSAQQRLKAKIEEKKFLLVLDDVWEQDPFKWESLCAPLTYGAKESRIIVTTRDQRVSDMVKASCVPLKSLSDEDLWPILKSYAFDGGSTSYGHVQLLESIGRQMVKKLKGSPLAAKTIGRLLNQSLDVWRWKDILDSEIFRLEQQHPDDISPVLKLSYDRLPGHLKQCFAYCSLFPKDYKFSRSELAQHWVAQSFIQTTKGDQHFDDLLYMSFFEESMYGGFYVMHDLIHDLAESISEGDCFRLGDDVRPNEFPETTRHVSIVTRHLDPMKLEELCKYEKLRTLHFLIGCGVDLSPLILDNLFTKLKRLRVLGLSGCRILELPSSIGNLKHLRFLDLSSTYISELPESLCGLHNLQVLKLENCWYLRALPGNMCALVNLMHLEVGYHSGDLFDCIQDLAKMTALQEVDVRAVKAKELGDMSMLRRLRIRNLEEVVTGREQAAQARLDSKKYLETLRLEWGYGRADHPSSEEEEGVLEGLQPVYSIRELDIINYGGVRSPRWLEDPTWVSVSFLEKVELTDCKNWEVLPPLGQLRCLKDLKISRMRRVRRIDPGQGGGGGGFEMLVGFPSLERMEFTDMPEWEEWEAPHERQQQQQIAFLPRLRTLHIYDCPKLKELPPLPLSLESLNIWNVGLTRLPRLVGYCGGAGRDADHMSLSQLSICYCPNLMSLDDDDDGLLQRPLPRLSVLRVSVGSSSMAQQLLNSILQNQSVTATLRTLEIRRVHHHRHQQQHQACTSSSSSLIVPPAPPPLPLEMEMVVVGPTNNNILDHLTSLTSLEIGDCSDLLQLRGLPSSLERLSIYDSHLDDGILATYLQGLCRLTYLYIFSCPHITSLPTTEVLCHLTALRQLSISHCQELMSWGGGVHNLIALQQLSIDGCPKIQCLPSVGLPESLLQVRINDSFQLDINFESSEGQSSR